MNEKVPNSPISITIPSLHAEQKDEQTFNQTFETNFDLTGKHSSDYKKPYTYKPNSREVIAVRIIENAWCSYRDKQMFRLLKHAVCAAEHSLSFEILKKISPLEAGLLRDPCLNLKVKFRFGGNEFPPIILFKIYTQVSDGSFSTYINGKKSIKPATNAAREACNQMGNRRFYEQIIFDSLQVQKGKIIDETDVVTLKDYMQYTSFMDELPARMGGKGNTWRTLNLDDLPRHTIFYDIVNYAKTQKMSAVLAKELPILLEKPNDERVQLKHIEILSKRTPDTVINTSINHLANSSFKPDTQTSSRRSKNALSKVAKMKKAYQYTRSETLTTDVDILPSASVRTQSVKEEDDTINDVFEDQVNDLYLWTQNLSINDDYLKSPRLPT